MSNYKANDIRRTLKTWKLLFNECSEFVCLSPKRFVITRRPLRIEAIEKIAWNNYWMKNTRNSHC